MLLTMDPDAILAQMEEALEELKDALYDLDRAIIDRVGLTGKPSAEEKKARSAIIKKLNKIRRQHYNLKTKGGPPKKVSLTFSALEYQALEEEADLEGLPLKQWLKRKLLG